MKTLYPMDMEEFMLALGHNTLVEQIRKCFEKCKFQNTKLEEKITGVKFIKCSYS